MQMNAKILTSGVVLLSAVVVPLYAAAQDAVQNAVDMPAIVMPQDDVASEADGLASNETVMALFRAQISERYLSDADQPVDNARLEALLSGEYISDYDAGDHDPVQFSNGIFERREPVADQAPVAAADTPADSEPVKEGGFTLTPAAIRAMSSMSRDQIEAIALMVQLAQDPSMTTVTPQASLSAIPSLSDEELEGTSPEQLLAALTSDPASQQAEPRVVNVGNGKNLALENWEAILSPDGTVQLSNSVLPGSRFPVTEGDIVGQFGRVTQVSIEPGDLFVEFETGDRILGETVSLEDGIPPIDGESEDRSIYGGEILVSQAAPVLEAAPASATAVASSLRPLARPASLSVQDADQEVVTENPNVTEETAPITRPLKRPDHLVVDVGDAEDATATVPGPQVTVTSSLSPTSSDRPQPKPSRL